jgi:hypothetical protein
LHGPGFHSERIGSQQLELEDDTWLFELTITSQKVKAQLNPLSQVTRYRFHQGIIVKFLGNENIKCDRVTCMAALGDVVAWLKFDRLLF